MIDILLNTFDVFFSFLVSFSSTGLFLSICVFGIFSGMINLFQYFMRGW